MSDRDDVIEAAGQAAALGLSSAMVIDLAMPVLVADFQGAHARNVIASDSIPARDAAADEAGIRQVLQTLTTILERTGVSLL